MSLIRQLRALDRRLRVLFIASALLTIPIIGEILTFADIHSGHRLGDLALFFKFAAIFMVPTSAILTVAILYISRPEPQLRRIETTLGALNLMMAFSIAWFFFTV